MEADSGTFKFRTQCAIFPVFGNGSVRIATAFAARFPDPSGKIATFIISSKPSDQAVGGNINYYTKLSDKSTIQFEESGEFFSNSLVAKLSQEQKALVEKSLELDNSSAVNTIKKKIYVVQATGDEVKKYKVKRDAAEGRYSLDLSVSKRRNLDQNQQLFVGSPILSKSKKLIGIVKSISIENGTLSVFEFTSEIINDTRPESAPPVQSSEGIDSVAEQDTRTESAPTVQSSERMNPVAEQAKDTLSHYDESDEDERKKHTVPKSIKFRIDEQGGGICFPSASVFIQFPAEAVLQPVTLTCVIVDHSDSQIKPRGGEVFCSSIVKLEPGDVVFKKPVTVLLSHSAAGKIENACYYDLSVQQLKQDWENLETKRISEVAELSDKIVSNFGNISKYLPIAKATIEKTGTLAVTTRIKYEEIIIHPEKPYVYSKLYGDESELKISFPADSVQQKCELRVKVFPVDELLDTRTRVFGTSLCFPVVKVTGQNENFVKPVKVELKYCNETVNEIDEKFFPVGKTLPLNSDFGKMLQSYKDTQGQYKWKNVSVATDATIQRVKKDLVQLTFSVKHFCNFVGMCKTEEGGTLPDEECIRFHPDESSGRLMAVLWAVHELKESTSLLWTIIAPHHLLMPTKTANEFLRSVPDAKLCKQLLNPGADIYFCVPLPESKHLLLDDAPVRLPLPESKHLLLDDAPVRFLAKFDSSVYTRLSGLQDLKKRDMYFLHSSCKKCTHVGKNNFGKAPIITTEMPEAHPLTEDSNFDDARNAPAQDLVKNLSPDTREKICIMLNTRIYGKDFRTLGRLMGLTDNEINQLELIDNPTEALLKKRGITVDKLIQFLLQKIFQQRNLIRKENSVYDATEFKEVGDAMQSVGMISLKNKQNHVAMYTATAWLIAIKDSVSYLFTNHHVHFSIVKRKDQTENKIKVVVQFDYLTNAQPSCAEHEVEQVAAVSNKEMDYAVLKINKRFSDRRSLNVSSRVPNAGNNIFAIGHPNSQPMKIMPGVIRPRKPKESLRTWLQDNATHHCPTSPCDGSNKEVICPHNLEESKYEEIVKRKEFVLVHNCQTDHGASGAPLVNGNGNVFAMHCRGMYFGNKQERGKPTYEFAHTIKSIALDIVQKDESLAKELFDGDFISQLKK